MPTDAIDVELRPTGADEVDLHSLRDWLGHEQIDGLRIAPPAPAPQPGLMGLDPGTALSVVLGSAAAVELVRSIHVWLQSRVKKVSVTVRTQGTEIVLDGQNLPDAERILREVIDATRTSGEG